MDIFLLIVGFLLAILGIIGSILPVLPGPILGWFGLLLLYFTKIVPVNYTLLSITLVISIIVLALDYIIPSIGTKKFGGTKFGVIGTTIGLVVGLFFLPPIGIIVGPFLGAFVGEMIYDSKNPKKALKASYGSFIGFLTGTLLKFVVAIIFTGLYFSIFWEYKASFFNF
ncbi:DUF456 domain-containing protein [Lutibacter maritimus]|jgi:hypothetical protein|uniref:DUF456 domain-containing protein n=1 Tax=Lutibacter maritimus TaxID=593133 RepID=A0A1I6R4S2_9FLAO|nr:DUF456 domain-containing protein [Lutibacter maritimus]SFS59614.1 hypothetical protein SAMN04488006_2192 [Lutibacter maritimus]